jgi:hypothetical protein
LVLRHENTVLRRQIGRVRYEPGAYKQFTANMGASRSPPDLRLLASPLRGPCLCRRDSGRNPGPRAESVLIPGPPNMASACGIASNAKILPSFEGMSEIERLLIGRTVTGLDVH